MPRVLRGRGAHISSVGEEDMEELSVSLCGPGGTVNLDQVRVIAEGLKDPASPGLTPGGVARLVLDGDPVSHLEGESCLKPSSVRMCLSAWDQFPLFG